MLAIGLIVLTSRKHVSNARNRVVLDGSVSFTVLINHPVTTVNKGRGRFYLHVKNSGFDPQRIICKNWQRNRSTCYLKIFVEVLIWGGKIVKRVSSWFSGSSVQKNARQ